MNFKLIIIYLIELTMNKPKVILVDPLPKISPGAYIFKYICVCEPKKYISNR